MEWKYYIANLYCGDERCSKRKALIITKKNEDYVRNLVRSKINGYILWLSVFAYNFSEEVVSEKELFAEDWLFVFCPELNKEYNKLTLPYIDEASFQDIKQEIMIYDLARIGD